MLDFDRIAERMDLEKVTQGVIVIIALGVIGFIFTVLAVSVFPILRENLGLVWY